MLVAGTVTIRPADTGDLEHILALYAQPQFDAGNVLPLATAQAIFARFSEYPDYTLYLAERAGAVIGSFALLIMHNLGHLGTPSAIMEDVVVAPAVRGHGIGKAMVRFAIERSREKGCYKLMLSSNAAREEAHAFYDSLGFARHGYSFRLELCEPAIDVRDIKGQEQ